MRGWKEAVEGSADVWPLHEVSVSLFKRSILTWYDLEEVLPRVIWVQREFIDFTEPQLDDSLEIKK